MVNEFDDYIPYDLTILYNSWWASTLQKYIKKNNYSWNWTIFSSVMQKIEHFRDHRGERFPNPSTICSPRELTAIPPFFRKIFFHVPFSR